jgi:hypothetical protein
MAKNKTQAEKAVKLPVSPAIQKQPETPEKEEGPLQVPRPVDVMMAVEPGAGTANRARQTTDMQQSIGNTRVNHMLNTPVQTKLAVGTSAGAQEREAGRTASAVMRMAAPEEARRVRSEEEENQTVQVSMIQRQAERRSQNVPTVQGQAGNARLSRPTGGVVQTRLTVNRPGDAYEQEADRVAARVMRMSRPDPAVGRTSQKPTEGTVQRRVCPTCQKEINRQAKAGEPLRGERLCPECRKKQAGAGTVMRLPVQGTPGEVPEVSPAVEGYVQSSRGGGQPLPETVRSNMEPRFGRDLSGVRVHDGPGANRAASELNAQAFTSGRDIHFGAGQYRSNTPEGEQLLAHELVHTMQQNGGIPARIQRLLPVEESSSGTETAGAEPRDESTMLVEEAGEESDTATEGVAEEEEITIETLDVGTPSECPRLIPDEPLIPDTAPGGESEAGDSSDIFESLMEFAPGGGILGGGLFGLGSQFAGKPASWAWRRLPISVRAFIINRALDAGAFVNKLLSKLLSRAVFLTGPVLGWVTSGVTGFLKRLRRAKDNVKVMMFEKFVRIITGNSVGFLWGYLKGLVQGFFVDGLLGIIQMIIDIVCLVRQFPRLIGALKKFLEVFPEEIARVSATIIDLNAAIDAALQGAADEVLELIKDPARIVGFINTVSGAVSGASEKIGEKFADGLMRVASLPEDKLGKAAGRLGGMALFEIALAVLTGGGGLAVTAAKLTVKLAVKLMAKVAKHLITVLRFIGFVLRSIRPYVTKVQRYLTSLFKAVAKRLSRVIDAIADFINAIGKRCRPGSIRCKVLPRTGRRAPRRVGARRLPNRIVAKRGKWPHSSRDAPGTGLKGHFDKHGHQVGARTVGAYDESARRTIESGRRFIYRDRATNHPRVGYWDPETGYFTATTQQGKRVIIHTHFPLDWKAARGLPGFSVD